MGKEGFLFGGVEVDFGIGGCEHIIEFDLDFGDGLLVPSEFDFGAVGPVVGVVVGVGQFVGGEMLGEHILLLYS